MAERSESGRQGRSSSRHWQWVVLAIVLLAVVAVALSFFGSSTTSKSESGSTSITSALSGSSTTTASTILVRASWTTYHHDLSRSGYDGSGGSTGSVRLQWSSSRLDGKIYAEPLVLAGTLFVVTENNTVYALNAVTGRVEWSTHLGQPIRRSQLPCGNIDPTGITGTPVIDESSGTIFVAAFRQPGMHQLVAMDVSSGAVRWQHEIDPPGSVPFVQQQRAALALSHGIVYVPFGGLFGDCGDYHGWVVGFPANGTGKMLSYEVPSGKGGGIWAPSGAAVGSDGGIFIATGNSLSSSVFDYGESVIHLSPTLQPVDFFAPSTWSALNKGDTDLGSVGPAILNDSTLFQIGKEGVGYLLNSSHLGGIGAEVFSANVCRGAYGGTAYAAPYLFVPCVDGLVTLRVQLGSSPSFSVVWRGPPFRAGPPIVAGGAVWTIDLSGGRLYSFRLQDGGVLFNRDLGDVVQFATPSAGDGFVFVPVASLVQGYILTG